MAESRFLLVKLPECLTSKEDIMVTARNRKSTRTSSHRSRAMGIQRQINSDYVSLGSELWRRPVTRFLFGGVALSMLAPIVMRIFRNPEVQTFMRENVEGIRSRIDGLIHSGQAEFDRLNQ